MAKKRKTTPIRLTSSRVRKWNRWLDNIVEEVGRLEHFVRFRNQFIAIVLDRFKDSRDGFWMYIGYAMIDEIYIRLARLVDSQSTSTKRRIYSLKALLVECKQCNDYFNRRRIVGRKHRPKTDGIERHNYDHMTALFDHYVGKTKDVLSAHDIQKDIWRLERATKKIVRFRNKAVAHNDYKKHLKNSPDETELLTAFNEIKSLTKKYALLIRRSEHLSNYHLGSDIISLFSVPWISSEHDAERFRKLFDKDSLAI